MPKQLPITKSERAYLAEMRALSTDKEGNEVVAGLTSEESLFYVLYAQRDLEGRTTKSDTSQYLALHDRHEKVRLAVLGAEMSLRDASPPIH